MSGLDAAKPPEPYETGAVRWVRAGWLLDGRGGPPRRNLCMALQDGRIERVAAAPPLSGPGVDLSHATVLPALIDVHVHLTFSGARDPRIRAAQLQHTPEEAFAAIQRHLSDQLRGGVAAVRDGGDRRGLVRQYKREHGAAADPPVHVAATCWAWHAAGRYGAMIGRVPAAAGGPEQAVKEGVEGCDHVKVIQSGLNSLDLFGRQGRPQFTVDELTAMVRAAHAAGRPVMVHANGGQSVRMALEAGCDSIEHGYFMGEENLRRLADSGTLWVPTAVPMAQLAASPVLSASQRDVARRTLEAQLEQIRKANEWGVVMALGTDAGSQGVEHGSAVRQELALLMSAGLSLGRAVGCAAAAAARPLGLTDRGELTPGRRADFIAVPGPPERLPGSLAQIEMMCVGGRWLCRSRVNALRGGPICGSAGF